MFKKAFSEVVQNLEVLSYIVSILLRQYMNFLINTRTPKNQNNLSYHTNISAMHYTSNIT